MKNTDNPCFICGNRYFVPANDYRRCTSCGHDVLISQPRQKHMINEILSLDEARRYGMLEAFKARVLRSSLQQREFLVDVGCGRGTFLYHNRMIFQAHLGIEVSPKAIEFARTKMHLNVGEDGSGINRTVSVATFWHSLEHMAAESAQGMLATLNRHASDNTNIVVSVPNNGSLQCALFKRKFAYYDPQNHIHQFTVRSLNQLLDRFGFEPIRFYASPLYVFFGYLQGSLNVCNRIHNYMYYRKKRGLPLLENPMKRLLLDGYNYVLMLLLLPVAGLLSMYDILFPYKGGVITICYQKKKQ